MSTIVTRAGKGAPLTNTEVDANFTNLNTDKLEINAALGTPVSVTLTNATGLPTAGLVDNAVTNAKLRDSAGLSVIGRGANSTGDPADIVAGTNHQVLRRDGSSLAFGAVDLSSNQAVTGTLPVNQGGTGITSFGSGIATWLGTPSSANLAAAVTDETGTGALVFGTNPVIDGATVPARTNPLAQAVRVAMTSATSGSNGIQVLNNANMNMGTNNFTVHWEGSLPTWAPTGSGSRSLVGSSTGTGIAGFRFNIDESPSGFLILLLRNTVSTITLDSTVAVSLANEAFAKVTATVTRETPSVAGAVVFYVNGVQLGNSVAIPAGTPISVSSLGSLYISGSNTERTSSNTTNAIIYNRALTAAEVLSLAINGPALADLGASQAGLITEPLDFTSGWSSLGTVSSLTATGFTADANNSGRRVSFAMAVGARYRLRAVGSITGSTIRFANQSAVGGSAQIYAILAEGAFDVSIEFTRENIGVAGLSVYATSSGGVVSLSVLQLTRIGITGQWNAENAQSNTGQIFDSSGNGNHALLPAAGATIIGRPTSQQRQVRWTNTWAGTNELQYIGGVNQAILPANAYIESIVGTVSGATPHDIIIGDGSDTDRYVTITTGLAAGTTTFTLASRVTDGTNLKLTVDPDTDATMSIAWVITFTTLES